MPLSPDYVRLVLADNFEDAKALLFEPMMAIHEAHLVMLAGVGLISRTDAGAIRNALARVDRDGVRRAVYDGSCEDLFFYVNRLVADVAGADVASRLHTARSRNDIDMTMYRMRLRGALLDLSAAALALRGALVAIASAHLDTVFAAHTHTQPAQPTTLAHYVMALVEQLERDETRLQAAWCSTNRCPLGACAITGTGFPIDRARTSVLLGFDAPTGNTYGSIATVDYLLESAGVASTLVLGVGRFVHDMLLWSTNEVGYLRLADGFVQVSSIMPQKRNPVALEHARSLASKAVGEFGAIAAAVHNTPFGDIVDTEDDLQPLVATAFRDAWRALALVAVTMAGATFDTVRMRARATDHWVTVTELADGLVREHDLPHAVAHEIVSRVVQTSGDTPPPDLGRRITAAARALGRDLDCRDDDLARWLSPDNFVAVRRTTGGPALDVIAGALQSARARIDRDDATLVATRAALARADAERHAALAAL